MYPIQLIVSTPIDYAHNLFENGIFYYNLTKENNRLKKQQIINSVKLLKFAALENENIRLRGLLENSFKLGEQFLSAEILSVNLVPYEHKVIVNKGLQFDVHVKQPVLNSAGIVGQVFRSSQFSSEVLLITDPSHAIPVQVNRNGLRTMAIGSGQLDTLNLPFLPNNADILPGDLLITSGLGGTFPQGYPVAIVNKFTVQPNKPFANISATPKAKLDRVREVLLVWSNTIPIPFTRMESNKTHTDVQDTEQ